MNARDSKIEIGTEIVIESGNGSGNGSEKENETANEKEKRKKKKNEKSGEIAKSEIKETASKETEEKGQSMFYICFQKLLYYKFENPLDLIT